MSAMVDNSRGSSSSGSNALGGAGAVLRARWRALAARERMALGLMALLLGGLLLWLLAIRPAWSTVRDAPAQLAQVEAQLQQMQRLADEARGLRGAAPVSSTQAATALRAATERLGPGARISIVGERATLTLATAIPTDALRSWLAEARSAARARPVDVTLTRSPAGFTGSVVVVSGAGS